MNVLRGDSGGPDLAARCDVLVLFENLAANHLHFVVDARDLLLIQHLVVPVFKRVERAVQAHITVVVDLVPVGSCNLGLRVCVRDDVTNLDQVEEREGELPALGKNPTREW